MLCYGDTDTKGWACPCLQGAYNLTKKDDHGHKPYAPCAWAGRRHSAAGPQRRLGLAKAAQLVNSIHTAYPKSQAPGPRTLVLGAGFLRDAYRAQVVMHSSSFHLWGGQVGGRGGAEMQSLAPAEKPQESSLARFRGMLLILILGLPALPGRTGRKGRESQWTLEVGCLGSKMHFVRGLCEYVRPLFVLRTDVLLWASLRLSTWQQSRSPSREIGSYLESEICRR